MQQIFVSLREEILRFWVSTGEIKFYKKFQRILVDYFYLTLERNAFNFIIDGGFVVIGSEQSPCDRLPVSYTHLRAHETPEHLVCRLLLEKKK